MMPPSSNIFKQFKIKHKLFFSYFFFTFIPVMLIGILSYNFAVSSIQSETTNIYKQMQDKRIDEIKQNMSRYELIANTINRNRKTQQFTALYNYNTYNEYYDYTNYIQPFTDTLINSVGNNMLIGIIRYNNGSEIIPGNFENLISDVFQPSNPISMSLGYFYVINHNRVENRSWFQAAATKNDGDFWAQSDFDKVNNNISLFSKIPAFGYKNDTAGLLRITVSLENIIGEALQTTEDFDLVFDKDNNLMTAQNLKIDYYNDNKEKLNALLNSEDSESMANTNSLFLKKAMEVDDWTIISVYDLKPMHEKVKLTRTVFFLYDIGAIALLFIVTSVLSSSFSKRIINITNVMKEFDITGDDIQIHDQHNDEISYLSQTFNNMRTELEKLIYEIYQVNIEKKDAQLKALQAQINPHFLYNSLSTVSRLAEFGQAESIVAIINALVTFYRLTLNKGDEIISIGNELNQVKAYVDIYKIRKGNQFNISYVINEEILEFLTVKIILQPFIENVFDHAMYNTKIPVNITITGDVCKDDIIFKVIDDGIGISAERLLEISNGTNPSKEHSGYGIKNVDDKIKLFFGYNYGVKISSVKGEGTTAEIKIPQYRYSAE